MSKRHTLTPPVRPDGFDQAFTIGPALADGTSVTTERCPEGEKYFLVTIRYREPEFEARLGGVSHPYSWTYRIAAVNADRAAAIGVREFEATARASSVSWRRDIVSVTARPDLKSEI